MSLSPGARLGAYEIRSPLGAGGMGEVYQAYDPRLRRSVALKVLPEAVAADAEHRKRFEREARAIAALSHPNIVTIYSVEEADGVQFLTMELVEGRPLTALMPRDGFPIERLLPIAIALADAVSAAHARGITHRDLKPGNILLSHDGRVKVLDFGLAKLTDSLDGSVAGAMDLPTQSLSTEGRIVGTVLYMSPEQAEGKVVGPRSDLFALGVILYELATGERPFKGDSTASLLSAILRDTPPPVTDTHPTLPPELARIVRRCLEKDPARRLQTALDLRNELEEIKVALPAAHALATATPMPPSSQDQSASDRAVRSSLVQRHRRGLLVGVAALALVAASRSPRGDGGLVDPPWAQRLIRSPCSRSTTRAAAPTWIIWLTASPKRSPTALRRCRFGRCGWSPEQWPRTIGVRRWIRARSAGASTCGPS